MAKVNIDKLFFAKVEQDDKDNLIFAIPEYIPGIRQMDARVKSTNEKLYGEGRVWAQEATVEEIEIDFDLTDLPNELYAKYLGHHIAEEGGVYALEDDEAPYIAILIETTKSGGKKAYRIYYKGKLNEPDESVKQKEGKKEFQTHKVTATFQPLTNNGMWKYAVDEDDPSAPSTLRETFFTSVVIPTPQTVVPSV